MTTLRYLGDTPTALIGAGMVCSLGLDVVGACAAARAGLVRPSELPTYEVAEPDELLGQPLTVHALPEATRGFEGLARIARLLELGLTDLRRQTDGTACSEVEPAFYLALPPRVRQTAMDAASPTADRAERDLATRLLQEALHAVRWLPGGVGPEVRAVSFEGSAGVHELCALAAGALARGELAHAVVGGVDSRIDLDHLAQLERDGRLKLPSFPAGLVAGEAAAFVLLERASARNASAPRIEAVAFDDDEEPVTSTRTPRGKALARVLGAVAPAACWQRYSDLWLISDHNGELYRAQEWGNALVHLAERLGPLGTPAPWLPAMSFGDTGAAYGAVALCQVMRAFARRYAPHSRATVLTSSEGGLRAAAVVSGGGT